MKKYALSRADFRLPDAQLNHIDMRLSFYEDRVTGEETLTLTPRVPLASIALNAKGLDIHEVAWVDDTRRVPLAIDYRVEDRLLVVAFGRTVPVGERVRIFIRATSYPSDTRLEGIYRDTTPPGAPQQYMSQCQQFGFQCIMPVIDDCTAKCTFRTTLEGDARYTHLISNGDLIARETVNGRTQVTYVNDRPMAPYLFIACAGTWDVLADTVTFPDGRSIALEYLVPPGRREGATLPMRILKQAITWQANAIGFVYPYTTYRTICMEKSLYGGMENVGNTTIITEAALIDRWLADARLIYAHGVIVHEYEHSHCGSGVTMQSVFDMWLNEAYTVNVERAFLATIFDPTFIRLREIDSTRAPGGPMAEEDTGAFGRIVREGVNDPDEVVDGVTYAKAPEVLNMLEALIGEKAYRDATRLYFSRYDGSNASTEDFIACFEETTGQSLEAFTREWLFTNGYPRVSARYTHDTDTGTLTLTLTQTRTGTGGAFVVPFRIAAATRDGHDIFDTHVVFDAPTQTFTLPCATPPAFVSLNRSAGFYGTCNDLSATPEQLALQVLHDADTFNRVDAMRRLTDSERRHLLAAVLEGEPLRKPSVAWQTLYRTIFNDTTLTDGIKAHLLTIDELPLDRTLHGYVADLPAIRQHLRRAAATLCGVTSIGEMLLANADTPTLPQQIEHRALKNALLNLLSAADTPEAYILLDRHLSIAENITDRLNTLSAIWRSHHPNRVSILAAAGETLRTSLCGYTGYLSIIASSPFDDVFDAIAAEEARATFDIAHPGLSRALYVAMARNTDQLWTPRGLMWLEATLKKYARVSEYNTLRILEPLEHYASFPAELRDEACRVLDAVLADLTPATAFPALTGRIRALR